MLTKHNCRHSLCRNSSNCCCTVLNATKHWTSRE